MVSIPLHVQACACRLNYSEHSRRKHCRHGGKRGSACMAGTSTSVRGYGNVHRGSRTSNTFVSALQASRGGKYTSHSICACSARRQLWTPELWRLTGVVWQAGGDTRTARSLFAPAQHDAGRDPHSDGAPEVQAHGVAGWRRRCNSRQVDISVPVGSDAGQPARGYHRHHSRCTAQRTQLL